MPGLLDFIQDPRTALAAGLLTPTLNSRTGPAISQGLQQANVQSLANNRILAGKQAVANAERAAQERKAFSAGLLRFDPNDPRGSAASLVQSGAIRNPNQLNALSGITHAITPPQRKSTLLTPEELEQQIQLRNAGRNVFIGDKPATLNDLKNLRDEDGNSPGADDIGKTIPELADDGFSVTTAADAKLARQAKTVDATLETLSRLANPLFLSEPGAVNRVVDDAIKTWNRLGQDDKNQALFESFSQGTVASLVRGVGETGNMSNKDIERGLALIPNSGDGIFELPDTREVAQGKIKQLRSWFDLALGAKTSSGTLGDMSDEELLRGF